MNRFRRREEMEYIFYFLNNIPLKIRRFIKCDFITNYKPKYLGVHDLEKTFDGRLLEETTHCCYNYYTIDERTTLILFGDDIFDPDVLYHEIGHVVHKELEFEDLDIFTMNDYAACNFLEAFATAFQSFMTLYQDEEWMYFHTVEDLFLQDPKTYYFFKHLFDYDPIKLIG